MPIRGLLSAPPLYFLQERQLVQAMPLSSLRGMRLGIEASVWLRKIDSKEPYQVAMGGIPLTLQKNIDDDLARFAEAGIKPFFVFNGLALTRKDRPFTSSDPRIGKRFSAWEAQLRGQTDHAKDLFEGSEKHLASNFIPHVLEYLRSRDVEFFRAPYLAWSQPYSELIFWQLAYFSHSKQHFAGLWAGPEVFLHGVSKVIVDIDFTRGLFEWVDMNSIILHLSLLPEQFIDSCILAGFDQIATFPPLVSDTQQFNFRAACDLVKTSRTGINAVQQHLSNPQVQKLQYMDLFLRTKALLRHHPIFDSGCSCELFHKEFAPSDLSDVIGPRLPNEVYFLLSQGAITPQVFNELTSGMLLEAPPLVDSQEYRNYLASLFSMRTHALALLTVGLNEFYQSKRVVLVRWFDHNVETELQHRSLHPQAQLPVRMRMPQLAVDLERIKVPLASLGLAATVRMVAARREHPDASALPIGQTDEALATILEHILTVSGFVSATGNLTPLGAALQQCPVEFQEEGMLLLSLIKAKALHGQRCTTLPTLPVPKVMNEPELTLVSRVLSVLHARARDRAWEGPVDLDLMAFNASIKALHRTLRHLGEMSLVSLFLRRRLQLSPRDYILLAHRLPFFHESNTAVGILLKHFVANPDVSRLATAFPALSQPADEVRRGLALWDTVMKMIVPLRAGGMITEEQGAEFEAANAFLATKRKALST